MGPREIRVLDCLVAMLERGTHIRFKTGLDKKNRPLLHDLKRRARDLNLRRSVNRATEWVPAYEGTTNRSLSHQRIDGPRIGASRSTKRRLLMTPSVPRSLKCASPLLINGDVRRQPRRTSARGILWAAERGAAQRCIGFWLTRLRNGRSTVLPAKDGSGVVRLYGIAQSAVESRELSEETLAFIGPSWSDFEGGPTELDPLDPIQVPRPPVCHRTQFGSSCDGPQGR